MLLGCAVLVGAGLAAAVLAVLPKAPARSADAPGPAGVRPQDAHGSALGAVVSGALVRRVLLCVGAGIALALVTSWPVLALIGAAGAWFLPGLLRSDGGAGALIERVGAVAGFTEMLRDTLSAAAGLGQAVSAASRCVPGPIAPQARELAAVIEDRTVPLDKALRHFGVELADPSGDLVALALMHAARNGARDLAPLLSDLAQAARDEAAMRVRINVAQARIRTTVRLITGVVIGLGTLLYAFDGAFLAPYGTALGQLALLFISGLFAAGFAWLARLSRPVELSRLLRRESEEAGDGVAGEGAVWLPGPRQSVPTHLMAGNS
jgi:Flp pilus assembly protein TadB